jgi:hypothetical protein
MSKDLPSPDMLRQLLCYDPATGFISRKSDGARVFQSIHSTGYFCGVILRKWFLAHRIAWALHYRDWPKNNIDHINGDRADNRIENLRDVPQTLNQRNRTRRENNTSGHNGVYWHKRASRWQAQIRINGKRKYLGRYADINDAIAARKAAECGHGFTERHGE